MSEHESPPPVDLDAAMLEAEAAMDAYQEDDEQPYDTRWLCSYIKALVAAVRDLRDVQVPELQALLAEAVARAEKAEKERDAYFRLACECYEPCYGDLGSPELTANVREAAGLEGEG